MPLLLTTKDFKGLLSPSEIVEATEDAHREWALGKAYNEPRRTLQAGLARLRMHAGALPNFDIMGVRVHAPISNVLDMPVGVKTQIVLLWNQKTLGLEAILAGEAYELHFPAAVSAVAAKYLSRKDARSLGIFGSSGLAKGHLLALTAVRNITRVKVYSRSKERRSAFASEMQRITGIEVVPVDSPKDVLIDTEIVVTATDSDVPVFDGNWVQDGTHITTSVAHNLGELEARKLASKPTDIDARTVERSNLIFSNSKEQISVDQQGTILDPVQTGIISLEDVHDLSEIFLNKFPGRTSDSQITLFYHSGGQGVSDIAIAYKIYKKAKEMGLGVEIPDVPAISRPWNSIGQSLD